MSETEPEALPAIYEHCVRAYKAMLAESTRVIGTSKDGFDSGEEITIELDNNIIVYEGFLTQLITGQLNLSVPYYTSIKNTLIKMGCIRQLKRGGGTAPSQWEMIMEPTPEAFLNQRVKPIPRPDRYSALEDQVRQLGSRLNDVEEMMDELVQAWAKHFGVKEVKE